MINRFKIYIILTIFALLVLNCSAQVLDMDCVPNTFYGAVGNSAHRLQWSGSTVQDLGVVAGSSYSSVLSLAHGYDILNNSTNRTLYSTVSTFPNPCIIIRYTGTSWDTIATDSLIFHNAAGNGRFIYFQHGGGSDAECIKRLNADGSLTEIFNDSSAFVFTVADIAVDSAGSIYFFRGSSIGSTTELTVIDSSGNILNSYSTNLNTLTGLYGSMFFNNTLYVGQITHQLFPVIIAGTTASLGTPVNTPSGLSIKDLDNCHEITTGVSEFDKEHFRIYYDNSRKSLEIFNPYLSVEDVRIFGADGRLVFNDYCNTGSNSYNFSGYGSGVYIVVIGENENRFSVKVAVF